MAVGKVKWFKDDLGYGFIEHLDGGPDIFVHYSVITPDPKGYRTLRANDYVEFEAEQRERGLQATFATVIPIPAGALR